VVAPCPHANASSGRMRRVCGIWMCDQAGRLDGWKVGWLSYLKVLETDDKVLEAGVTKIVRLT
jgi:hypothetical protein